MELQLALFVRCVVGNYFMLVMVIKMIWSILIVRSVWGGQVEYDERIIYKFLLFFRSRCGYNYWPWS